MAATVHPVHLESLDEALIPLKTLLEPSNSEKTFVDSLLAPFRPCTKVQTYMVHCPMPIAENLLIKSHECRWSTRKITTVSISGKINIFREYNMRIYALLLIVLFFRSRGVGRTIGKFNFLFVIVDDLRIALRSYDDANAYTPNMDNLARNSFIFSNVYAQQSLCAPSRNSLLTGRRPDTLHLYDFYSYWRDSVGNFSTLPQHLKEHGYTTMSIGKVFHPGISSNCSDDSPYSWTETPFHPYTQRYQNSAVCKEKTDSKLAQNLICPVKVSLMPNKTLPDIEILNEARKFLDKHKTDAKPFFLAVGFHKPHIPFKYPKKYLKYHPLDNFNIPDPYKWPRNVSSVAYNPWTDLREREDVKEIHLKFPWKKIPENFGKRIIQSYYASVSYIDDLIGTLLDHLSIRNLRGDTVVILTSDHGWSLGEHAEWAKYSNFDIAVRVPLLISIPRSIYEVWKHRARIESLVELTDIFPTVAELAGIPIPVCPKAGRRKNTLVMPNPCSEGISLVPLMKAVSESKVIPWKKAAFSQYPRPGMKPTLHPNSDKPRLEEINIMGYSVKSKRYRYTAWTLFSHKTKKPNWNRIVAEELYDHKLDRNEINNIASYPSLLKLKEKLRKLLRQGWQNVLPI